MNFLDFKCFQKSKHRRHSQDPRRGQCWGGVSRRSSTHKQGGAVRLWGKVTAHSSGGRVAPTHAPRRAPKHPRRAVWGAQLTAEVLGRGAGSRGACRARRLTAPCCCSSSSPSSLVLCIRYLPPAVRISPFISALLHSSSDEHRLLTPEGV